MVVRRGSSSIVVDEMMVLEGADWRDWRSLFVIFIDS